MKGNTEPNTLKKRFLSFTLAAAMVVTNLVTDVNTAYASTGNQVDFEMTGADLAAAIDQAIQDRVEITPEDLDFTNGNIEKFETVFFGDGNVYEAFPNLESSGMDADLRVFVRLPEDADDMYMVTGDEDVIFLYINNGDETISCSTSIYRTVDGEEKVKRTKRVNVASFESKFGEEEADYGSGSETETPVPDATPSEAAPKEEAETATKTEAEKALTAAISQKEVPVVAEKAATSSQITATPSETRPEKPQHSSKPSGGTSDLVGIGNCSTAKYYETTLAALKALEDCQDHKITYTINPDAGARIIDGPLGAEDGESVTFGVKNQIGYQVESVTANGVLLEADSESANEDGSDTVWFTISEIAEEQDVEVNLTENGAHPAVVLPDIEMEDGMIIRISAEEEVLPEGVRATAARVSQEVEAAVGENTGSDLVYAYDINLWLGDTLLDSEIWGGSKKVQVQFAGTPVKEQSASADRLEVVYVQTVQDEVKEEKEKVAKEEMEVRPEDIVDVAAVSQPVDAAGDAVVEAIDFQAEHFSIYALVGTRGVESAQQVTMMVGESRTFKCSRYDWKHDWEHDWELESNKGNLEIEGESNRRSVTVNALEATNANQTVKLECDEHDYKIKITVLPKASDDFHYKYSDSSSKSSLYYSTDGSSLNSLEQDQELVLPKTTPVMFFVKIEEGYTAESTFQHKNGKNDYGTAWKNGIYSGLGDASSSLNGIDFTAAIQEAGREGCTNEFHYTDQSEDYRYREFKINAVPVRIHIAYDLNGGAADQDFTDHNTYRHENVSQSELQGSYTQVTVPAEIPVREGYRFTGWTFGDKSVQPGDTVQISDLWTYTAQADVTYTFEAGWEADTFQITYNGLEDAETTGNPESYSTADDTFTLNNPKRAGYEFAGWTGTGLPDTVSKNVTIERGSTGNRTYTALWKKGYDDGLIQAGDAREDGTDENKQGKIYVNVYADGELQTADHEVAFVYKDVNAIDLKISVKTQDYILNRVFAKQTGSDKFEEHTLSHVEGGSTVHIYLTSTYKAEYYENGILLDGEYQDTNTYTTAVNVEHPNHKEYNLAQAYSTSITVKRLPAEEGKTVTGWYLNDGTGLYAPETQVKAGENLSGSRVYKFSCTSTINQYELAADIDHNGTVRIGDSDPVQDQAVVSLSYGETVPEVVLTAAENYMIKTVYVNENGQKKSITLPNGTTAYTYTTAQPMSSRIDISAVTEEIKPALDVDKRITKITTKIGLFDHSITNEKAIRAHQLKTGDEIQYTVTISNNGNLDLTGLTFNDTLVTRIQPVDSLKAGEKAERTYTYTVKETDIISGAVVNEVTVTADNGQTSAWDRVEKLTVPAKADISVEKSIEKIVTKQGETITKGLGTGWGAYAAKEGDVIYYQILIRNDGEIDAENLRVKDSLVTLSGDDAQIEKLQAHDKKVITYTYTVQEDDLGTGVLYGAVWNEVSVKGADIYEADSCTQRTEKSNRKLDAVKTIQRLTDHSDGTVYEGAGLEGKKADLGDTITYRIVLTNSGNRTLHRIELDDFLTRDWKIDPEFRKLHLDPTVISELAPGESREITYDYTVIEEDLGHKLINTVIANAVLQADDSSSVSIRTEAADPSLKVDKEITSIVKADGTGVDSSDLSYKLAAGDTVTYQIKVTNTGNKTVKDITVKDTLNGTELSLEQAYILALKPGEEAAVSYSYTVTEADILKGELRNAATAQASGNPDVIPDEVIRETVEADHSFTIKKEVVEEKSQYQIGDIINYRITVTNEGNVALKELTVDDQFSGKGELQIEEKDTYTVRENLITIHEIPAGGTEEILCSYQVVKADRGSVITNAATAVYDTVSGKDEVNSQVETVYDIHVTHRFADGEEAGALLPENYTMENQKPGNYVIQAGAVEGYTAVPEQAEIQLAEGDAEVEFIYHKNAADDGGNGNNGSSNGGSGSSGGGSAVGGGRYTDGSQSGPGVSVTISPEEVPLAGLPETGMGTALIDDGEIPLAALPKTGESSRAMLTMVFSGILLAFTAIGKRKKEA